MISNFSIDKENCYFDWTDTNHNIINALRRCLLKDTEIYGMKVNSQSTLFYMLKLEVVDQIFQSIYINQENYSALIEKYGNKPVTFSLIVDKNSYKEDFRMVISKEIKFYIDKKELTDINLIKDNIELFTADKRFDINIFGTISTIKYKLIGAYTPFYKVVENVNKMKTYTVKFNLLELFSYKNTLLIGFDIMLDQLKYLYDFLMNNKELDTSLDIKFEDVKILQTALTLITREINNLHRTYCISYGKIHNFRDIYTLSFITDKDDPKESKILIKEAYDNLVSKIKKAMDTIKTEMSKDKKFTTVITVY